MNRGHSNALLDCMLVTRDGNAYPDQPEASHRDGANSQPVAHRKISEMIHERRKPRFDAEASTLVVLRDHDVASDEPKQHTGRHHEEAD